MVVGALAAAYAGVFSSTVLACSIAATEPFVATLMESTPRLCRCDAGMFTAGQVIPADVNPDRGPSHPSSGTAAAVAPAGQRPRAGTVASCVHETRPAGSPPAWYAAGIVSAGSARITTTPWTPEIWRSWAASGTAGPARGLLGRALRRI